MYKKNIIIFNTLLYCNSFSHILKWLVRRIWYRSCCRFNKCLLHAFFPSFLQSLVIFFCSVTFIKIPWLLSKKSWKNFLLPLKNALNGSIEQKVEFLHFLAHILWSFARYKLILTLMIIYNKAWSCSLIISEQFWEINT